MENIFFDRIKEKDAELYDEKIRQELDRLSKEKKAIEEENIKLEERLIAELKKKQQLWPKTEEYANAIEKMIINIMENASLPAGKIDNLDSYESLGKTSTDTVKYENKDYATGYKVRGGILEVTLNYSHVNGFNSIETPSIDWDYLSIILCQRGILFEKINEQRETYPSPWGETISVLKLFCIGKFFNLTKNALDFDEFKSIKR